MPSAVPQEVVANTPVLRWVSTRSGRSTPTRARSHLAPSRLSSRLASPSARTIHSGGEHCVAALRQVGKDLVDPQARLTAVGRAVRTAAMASSRWARDQPDRAASSMAMTTLQAHRPRPAQEPPDGEPLDRVDQVRDGRDVKVLLGVRQSGLVKQPEDGWPAIRTALDPRDGLRLHARSY